MRWELTRDGFNREVVEAGDCPGVLVRLHEPPAIVGIVQKVKEELGVRLDGVDAGIEEETVSDR